MVREKAKLNEGFSELKKHIDRYEKSLLADIDKTKKNLKQIFDGIKSRIAKDLKKFKDDNFYDVKSFYDLRQSLYGPSQLHRRRYSDIYFDIPQNIPTWKKVVNKHIPEKFLNDLHIKARKYDKKN